MATLGITFAIKDTGEPPSMLAQWSSVCVGEKAGLCFYRKLLTQVAEG